MKPKKNQHNIINRITFIKIIHPRKPAISLSYPYRFNNLLTPSSPTLFKTILSQTSPQTFHLTVLRDCAIKGNESSKDFFYDPILNNTRSPSNIRETKKDSPFPFPFSPSPPPSRFSTGWLFFKTKKRQNEQVASIIPACTLKLPRFFSSPPPIIKACSLARPTVQTLNTGCSLNIRGRESVADGIWEEGRKKKGGGEWGERLAETSCKDFWSCSRVTSSFCRDYGTEMG